MRRWTQADVNDLRRLFSERLTDRKIAKLLSRTQVAVQAKRRDIGLSRRRVPRTSGFWTLDRQRELERLHERNWSDIQLGHHFGKTTRAVAVQRQKQGAVAYNCHPKTSLRSYSVGSLMFELRRRGYTVTDRER